MIDKQTIAELSKFQTGGYFVTSLYLNVDGRRYNKKDYEIKLKALIKDRKQEIENLGLNQEVHNSLHTDFDRISKFINQEFDGKRAKSLTIFCCSALNLWRLFELPQAIHPRLVVSKQPYLRPLNSLLAENKRYFVIIASRNQAKLYDYYMGELQEYSRILDDVPSQGKVAGWYGLEERRIERRVDDYVHRHFKNVAEGAFNYYQNNHPDLFIIGGRKENITEFERQLHSTIQSRIIARLAVDIDISTTDLLSILEKTVQDFEITEQDRLLKQLFEATGPSGLGVTGLKATLKALWQWQVNTLFITEDYSQPGFYCPECWYMSNNEEICANDQTPMKASHDIIEDAIETAIFQNCEIVRIKNKSALKEVEHIGALLRFRIE